jgi:hypothetical protein
MLTRGLLVAVIAAFLPAAPAAGAGTVTRSGATLAVADTAQISIGIAQTPTAVTIQLDPGTVLTPQPGSNCTLAASVITCANQAGIDVVAITSAGGADLVSVQDLSKRVRFDAGDGADSLFASFGAAVTGRLTFNGQGGDDVFTGGDAADRFDGGQGEDWSFVSPGGDEYIGGPGFDLLTAPDERVVRVSLDGVADDDLGDGAVANIHADVEDIFSRFGSGGDTLVGSAADNQLLSGGGGDVLVGGGGFDMLSAGGGSDQLFARDGLADGIDCGEGTDFAQVDDVDTTVDCEVVDVSADLRPDADGDGVRKPVDCNDADPNVRPGAAERLEDGVDQDCDGRDGVDLDRDRDGVPRPQDCDDNRRAVRPGRREVPGNRVDENCDGRKAPFPDLSVQVVLNLQVFRTHSVVTRLRIVRLRAGQRIDVRCDGDGCPFRSRRAAAPKRKRELNLTRLLDGERLLPGTLLRVRIRDARRLDKTFSFELRAGSRPVRTVRCSAPPDRRPRRC